MHILRATARTDVPEIGIKQADTFYLVYDSRRRCCHLVKWEQVRWVCSCGKGKCEHKFRVSEFVFAESQQT